MSGPGERIPRDALLARLRAHIDRTLDPLIPSDRPLALLDFPQAPNVGDSAIWLGELAWLRASGRPRPCFTTSNETFAPESLRRRIGDGVLLLSGGGNFGDLYEPHQSFRDDVMTRFRDRPIVQLPQSMHFRSRERLERTRRVVDAHPDVTLLVRDHPSLAFARAQFDAPVHLCPDMAFCLGALARPAPPVLDTLWLARRDKESAIAGDVPKDVPRVDWIRDDRSALVSWHRFLTRELRHRPFLRRPFGALHRATFSSVAENRLVRGCETLARGARVVTDRLHGHVLSLLLGIPHLILDNSYGKVKACYDAWTGACELVEWCEDPEEALRRLASAPEQAPPPAHAPHPTIA